MEIPMSIEDFHRLPRHPDWKHEYWDGALQLSFRPYPPHFWRDVSLPVSVKRRHDVRPLETSEAALRAFLTGFWRAEDPYRTVDEEVAGPWLTSGLDTSLARLAEPGGAIVEEDGEIIGAVLLEHPYRDRTAPMLSWLAVRSGFRCDGLGSSMLGAITAALHSAGVQRLDSGASPGNRASLFWHWRNGFQAEPDPIARLRVDARRR